MNEHNRNVSKIVNSVSEEIGGFSGERPPRGPSLKFKSLSEIAPEIHQNAVSKGWYEGFDKHDMYHVKNRYMLIISEIAEALEDVRDQKMGVRYDSHRKPYGFPSEIADIVIRVLDYTQAIGLHFSEYELTCPKWEPHDLPDTQVSSCLYDMCVKVTRQDFVGVIRSCNYLACCLQFDLLEIINLKHRYNKTRTYRHGGKSL